MNNFYDSPFTSEHQHVFLGDGHETSERKTWSVIALCSVMMVIEIIGGSYFGSLALVADGLHMSTHAGAMLIAALAYTYARKHAHDPKFIFGTGKLGDLAGFTSAIILAMIALLIGYEAVARLISPVDIHFGEAIPIAVVGLLVNIASAWLLSADHHHGHSHGHDHGHAHHDEEHHHSDDHADETQYIQSDAGTLALSIFEDGVPPVFRVKQLSDNDLLLAEDLTVVTIRPDGLRQTFIFAQHDGFLESTAAIPEPHAFDVELELKDTQHILHFEEHHNHDGHHHHHVDATDHNMRAAYVHVIADTAVSVLAIIGLILASIFGWLWMDALAGIVGALVIANWSYGLAKDTGAILLDMNLDQRLLNKVRAVVEKNGDQVLDLHVWRLGPGHFGAIVSLTTNKGQVIPAFYQRVLKQITGLSHITVEVHHQSQ
ncbi:CDF family Co(II)/Ni(II) efflux transporter DmeF [Undibacterium sp. RuRC25W]|uniref:CDF family Co(II)/Ni(II) efflux transporter DmeF n=1 Tax=Undibacterium sp. RuRC25W TaxID=3413047 RepID=UPI003BEF6A44